MNASTTITAPSKTLLSGWERAILALPALDYRACRASGAGCVPARAAADNDQDSEMNT
jgi:hypothetical protein